MIAETTLSKVSFYSIINQVNILGCCWAFHKIKVRHLNMSPNYPIKLKVNWGNKETIISQYMAGTKVILSNLRQELKIYCPHLQYRHAPPLNAMISCKFMEDFLNLSLNYPIWLYKEGNMAYNQHMWDNYDVCCLFQMCTSRHRFRPRL